MTRSILAIVTVALTVAVPAARGADLDITRDVWGVPHIFVPPAIGSKAKQLRALGFAQGYVTAQDRMVQLEFFRRAGKGRLSEIAFLGPGYLPGDIEARRDGFTDVELREQVRRLPAKPRIMFQAFADGVNRFLTEVQANPALAPIEFSLLGLSPQPWDVSDTAAIAMLQIRRFGQNGGDELSNAVLLLDLLAEFPPAEAQGIFTDVVWHRDPTAPTTIDPAEQAFSAPPASFFAPAQVQLIQAHEAAIRGASMAMADEQTMVAGLRKSIGWPDEHPATASNAMVVSGALTASGVPILLGGPQVGMSLPSFFHGVGLHGGGYDAAGVTVPAGPGLVIGRTANAAWTLTSGITDNTDVYIEQLNPSDPKQYLYKGKYRQMECRNEVFNPAGQPSQTIEICRTVHGPVFASYPGEDIAFSRDLYFFGRETKAAAQLVSLGFAPTFRKFQSTINKLEASLNCMYADTSGTIAYFHRGMLPVRPASVDPRLPLSGTGDDDVVGFVKGRHMPTAINPPLGYIAQWNNKPIQGWPADEQRELWGGADRVQILIDQLAAAKAAHHPITSTDVVDYMRKAATSDIFAPRVAPYLRTAVDALPPATPDLPQLDAATDLIESWLTGGAGLVATGASIPDPGVTIYRAWRVALQSALFGDELGVHNRGLDYAVTRVNDNADSSGDLSSPDAILLRALAWPTAAFPTSRDYFMNVTTMTNPGRDATLVEALRTAIGALTAQYGTSDPAQWTTPKITVQFDTTSAAPFLYGQTIIEREDRGSINQVVELLPTPVAQLVLPPGETAHIPPAAFPEPPHLRDQVALYEGFGFHSNPNTLADLEGPTTTQTITLPY